VSLNIADLEADFIHNWVIFQDNKGDNTVSFEIMELEKIKRIVENAATNIDNDEEAFVRRWLKWKVTRF
jgi:DNA polymerase-3 subunit alpha